MADKLPDDVWISKGRYGYHVREGKGHKPLYKREKYIRAVPSPTSELVAALDECKALLVEVCLATGTPLPEASMSRFEAALAAHGGK